ncbi:MAG: hypothetical protein ACLQHS_01620, partial [Candidatus Limnocylindrales bacterium]
MDNGRAEAGRSWASVRRLDLGEPGRTANAKHATWIGDVGDGNRRSAKLGQRSQLERRHDLTDRHAT